MKNQKGKKAFYGGKELPDEATIESRLKREFEFRDLEFSSIICRIKGPGDSAEVIHKYVS